MFSSNPLPTTNVFSPPDSFFDYETHDDDDIPFNYHHHQLYTCPPPPVTTDDELLLQHQFSQGSYDQEDLLDSVVVSSYRKKVETSSKQKDGHSKINTARGPRDRRVRLSIDISRKFFCLQDLLGFDKASKTLDWLLTKSLSGIKDLVEQTNHCCSSSSVVTDEESKARFLESIKENFSSDNEKEKNLVKCVDGKGKKSSEVGSKFGGSEENFSREQSRTEARARARERTKEKKLSNFQEHKRFRLSDN